MRGHAGPDPANPPASAVGRDRTTAVKQPRHQPSSPTFQRTMADRDSGLMLPGSYGVRMDHHATTRRRTCLNYILAAYMASGH
jgi:hypothetical protein